MQPLTRYWQTHQGGDSPLPVIHDHVRAHGVPDAAAVQVLALKAVLPESAVRGAVSCYADLHAPSHVPRFCTGTSCLLAGARREGLRDGTLAGVESRWGRATAPVHVSARPVPGTLFLSFQFPETHANRLTGPHLDAQSKATAVRLRVQP